MRPGRLWVGTSGYEYDHWRGVFYILVVPRLLNYIVAVYLIIIGILGVLH